MITKASDSSLPPLFSPRVWVGPLALMLLLAVLAAGGEPLRLLLRFDRAAIAAGEWWRLLTASFVHLGWYHLMLNQVGLVVLALLCPELLSPLVFARRVLLLALSMTLCLYAFDADLQTYVGMSGVVHGLFVLGLLPQVLRREPVSTVAMLFLVGKLAYEQLAGAPLSDEAAIGDSVITASHLYGSLSALAYVGVFRTWAGNEQFWKTESNAAPEH